MYFTLQILKTIADVMNFTNEFYESVDSEIEKMGKIQENGSATGVLGEMVNSFFLDFLIFKLF